MTIIVNGEARELSAQTLKDLLQALELGQAVVATALNGRFVPAKARGAAALTQGDAVEILAPMQGG